MLARKLTQEQLLRQARNVLEQPFAIPELEAEKPYFRSADDDGKQRTMLLVTFFRDGDANIQTVHPYHYELRFRTPEFGGGGKSPRVWAALRILAWAIKLDNEEPLR